MKQMLLRCRRFVVAAMMLLVSSPAWGTELSTPPLEAKPGQLISVPLRIDRVDNLAGVKLVMRYDKNALTFKSAGKTRHTSSLMHIVNSKTPGKLVIVMAGASGIKGKDVPIFVLRFQVREDAKKGSVRMEAGEIQLMDDKLNDLKCDVRLNPITILADGTDTKAGEKDAGTSADAKTDAEKTEPASRESLKTSERKPAASDKGSAEADRSSSEKPAAGEAEKSPSEKPAAGEAEKKADAEKAEKDTEEAVEQEEKTSHEETAKEETEGKTGDASGKPDGSSDESKEKADHE